MILSDIYDVYLYEFFKFKIIAKLELNILNHLK